MRLAELQRAFQSHVLEDNVSIAGSIAGQINGSPEMPVPVRLEVYSEAYSLRLIEALGANFPQLQRLLGEASFAEVARRYITQYPSMHFSVRWFGDHLTTALRRRFRGRPWLAELAQWEWAIAAAFDAADVAPLPLTALASVDPEEWPELQFQPHPSLQRLLLHTNAPALFKSLGNEVEAPAPMTLDRPQHWIIWRQDLTTRYRPLGIAEALALGTLCAGGNFEEICESLCESHHPEEVPAIAAGMLKGWILEGLLADPEGERC